LTRVAFVLLGVTSFTFFGALDLERLDPEWRASERYKARVTLAAIDEHARDMTAAAWVESEARRLDQAKKQEFTRFFDSSRTSASPVQIVRAAAAELGRKAPKVRPDIVTAASSDPIGVPERVRTYLQSDEVEVHFSVPEQPSLAEIRVANERLTHHELRMRS